VKQHQEITQEPDTAKGPVGRGTSALLTQEDRSDYRIQYRGYRATFYYLKILSVFLGITALSPPG